MAATRGRARATWAQQRLLVVLGLPTLALALGATTISSYVPVLLRDFTGPMVSGALLATTAPWVIVALPFVAFAATTVMTLPFSLIMGLIPRGGDNGAATRLFGVSRGAGLIAGPLLAGTAIAASGGLFADTEGYAALFGVAALALFASMPLLRRTSARTVG